MLSSAAAAALSTLPRSFHHTRRTRPHLTSRLCPNTNLIRPRERRKRPTFPFFFVFFFFFVSNYPRLDRSRARRINAVTGDNKTIFYAAAGQLLLPTSFRDHAYVRAANCPRRQRHFRWIYVLSLGNQEDFLVVSLLVYCYAGRKKIIFT